MAIRLHHHGKRIPADQRAYTPLDRGVARGVFLPRLQNGVDVGGVGGIGEVRACPTGLVDEGFQQVMRTLDAVSLDNRGQRLEPLLGFFTVDLGNIQ